MISPQLQEELVEVTTSRRKWWAIKFDGKYYGEVILPGEGTEGFSFNLYSKKEDAENEAKEFLEGSECPYEIVEICWSEVK